MALLPPLPVLDRLPDAWVLFFSHCMSTVIFNQLRLLASGTRRSLNKFLLRVPRNFLPSISSTARLTRIRVSMGHPSIAPNFPLRLQQLTVNIYRFGFLVAQSVHQMAKRQRLPYLADASLCTAKLPDTTSRDWRFDSRGT